MTVLGLIRPRPYTPQNTREKNLLYWNLLFNHPANIAYSTFEAGILVSTANKVRISGSHCYEVKVTEKNETKEMRLVTAATEITAWTCLDISSLICIIVSEQVYKTKIK